jgi:AcrR family transcriptional regulator
MARVVNEKEFAARRNEILDVAQRLIYTKGYQQMSIQDILDTLNMSKGAFYHYFDSKPRLMEALSNRMIAESLQFMIPITRDPQLSAVEKLHSYFDTAARWKTARKDLLMALLRVWYDDDNLVMRQKVTREGSTQVAPLITEMINQGIGEGAFTTLYPEQVAEVILALMFALSDSLCVQILKSEYIQDEAERQRLVQQIETLVDVYSDAIERVLGSAAGSLKIVEIDLLKEWLISPVETAEAGFPETL